MANKKSPDLQGNPPPALAVSHTHSTTTGMVLNQEELMYELVYLIEQLRDMLQMTSHYKLVFDCQQRLTQNPPKPPSDHHQHVLDLCARAERIVAFTRAFERLY